MTDLIIGDEGFEFEGGDFKVAESSEQDIERILNISKGDIPRFPLLGVGMVRMVNAPIDIISLKKEIRKELESDNFKVIGLEVGLDGEIWVNAIKRVV